MPRYLKYGKELKPLNHEGVTDRKPYPKAMPHAIRFCPDCTTRLGTEIYHLATSAIYKTTTEA